MEQGQDGSLDIAGSLRGEHLFVTGATGFVGKVLVEKLLWSVPEIGGLSLLVRGDDERKAADRFRDEVLASPALARLRARHGEGWEAWVAGKVEVVEGDLGQDRFGLSDDAYAALCERVDRVVACAATVTFDERLDRAVELNTRGAGRTLALARDAGDVPLVHVSTCFVSGRRQGTVPEVLPEVGEGGQEVDTILEALDRASREADAAGGSDVALVAAGAEQAARYGFHDVYTLTKALGERLVAARRGSVPVAIVRPAIVESAVAEPLPGWLQAVRVMDPLLVVYGRGLVPELPGAADVPLEVVPVDHVVHAVLAALAELPKPGAGEAAKGAAGGGLGIYQVGSARNPVTLGELMTHAREGFAHSPLRDPEGEPIRVAPARFTDPDLLHRKLTARLQRVRARSRRRGGFGAESRAARRSARLALEDRRLEHFLRLIEVYRPYVRHGARYNDDATRRLRARLSAADQAEFPFDVTALDWRDYIARIHVPGLVRYALRAEGGAPRPAPEEAPLAERQAAAEALAARAGNLFELFAGVAEAHPDLTAFQTYRGGVWLRYSYGQALTATANVAWRLATERGVGPGDRVVLWASGSPEWAITAFAVLRLGAVLVPVDPQWPVGEAVEAARLVGAKVI